MLTLAPRIFFHVSFDANISLGCQYLDQLFFSFFLTFRLFLFRRMEILQDRTTLISLHATTDVPKGSPKRRPLVRSTFFPGNITEIRARATEKSEQEATLIKADLSPPFQINRFHCAVFPSSRSSRGNGRMRNYIRVASGGRK